MDLYLSHGESQGPSTTSALGDTSRRNSARRNNDDFRRIIEEINFHRDRDLTRSTSGRLVTDGDFGFLLVSVDTFWTDLFVRRFVCNVDSINEHADDLLFFVRKSQRHTSSIVGTLGRSTVRQETGIDVFRKGSKKLPIGDSEIDWEETVYLNLILQQFDYTLCVAICTRTSPRDLQILSKRCESVYATPSRRSMETKGASEDITYPNIFFSLDNYEDLLGNLVVRDGEMVCVELVAQDKCGPTRVTLFQGSIRYEALKRVYDTRSSMTSRFVSRFTFGSKNNSRTEFVRMRGPSGRGHAEMAVTKPKNCSFVETPTSEPGFFLTDLEDWDDMEIVSPKSHFNCSLNCLCIPSCKLKRTNSHPIPLTPIHSGKKDPMYSSGNRRNSDPSANLNNFIRSAATAFGGDKEELAVDYSSADERRSRSNSRNSGIVSHGDGIDTCHTRETDGSGHPVTEIEAGDVRDELDDTSYNQLWSMRGFNQAFHTWKENKRINSPPLNAFITYVTLPWHLIIAQLLGQNQNSQPMLTF